ncbi:choice-of-anchor P family protein [Streptomyces sp. NPDC086554]|uniref:choice-of-anchor P family protein n=1 Tax=Streptomyces sp. NPDC086554 TaxID=3154864 RepID=UPI003447A186
MAFELGVGDTAQTCEGKTDAKGAATCTVDVADQALTDDATVPLTAAFAGDDAYTKSDDSEKLKLQHVEGRSYGLAATVPLPLIPVGIDPTPDTGTVRSAGAETKAPACGQGVSAIVLNADALCAKVVTEVGPSAATATSTVADASIGLPGLPVIGISGLTSTSSSSCDAAKGSVSLKLTVAGADVVIGSSTSSAHDCV